MRLDHRRDLGPHGGLVELLVGLNDKVDVGQKVAIQRNAFDKVVAEYICGSAGEVTVCRTDATSKPGTPLVFILFDSAPQERTDARSRVTSSCEESSDRHGCPKAPVPPGQAYPAT
jgi:hypothetical protein